MFGHLNWLHSVTDLNSYENQDIMREDKVNSIKDVREGLIVDAQDYLDNWFLSIIVKVQPNNEQECVKLNFLPYPKGNRDEWISKNDLHRISGAYCNVEVKDKTDKEVILKNLNGLRDYHKKFQNPSL